jgi:LytS/YehU family sensor histidine kinase
VVIKLSDMLHYLLYECSAAKVPLKKEVQLIENYRHLQQIRFGHRLDIKLSIDGSVDECKIAPMLLLPFVENSFKHGVGKDRNNSWIKMKLEVSAKKLAFEISNSINTNSQNDTDKSYGGIGLTNVKKRLQLIYPEKHQLLLEKLNNEYTALLNLDLAK